MSDHSEMLEEMQFRAELEKVSSNPDPAEFGKFLAWQIFHQRKTCAGYCATIDYLKETVEDIKKESKWRDNKFVGALSGISAIIGGGLILLFEYVRSTLQKGT